MNIQELKKDQFILSKHLGTSLLRDNTFFKWKLWLKCWQRSSGVLNPNLDTMPSVISKAILAFIKGFVPKPFYILRCFAEQDRPGSLSGDLSGLMAPTEKQVEVMAQTDFAQL